MLVCETPLANEAFVELPIQAGDNAARLVGRACEKFPRWGADAGQVKLFLVREGRERALAVEDNPSLAASVLISANKLAADDCVEPGSWLLARVPSQPVAAAPSGRGAALAGTGAADVRARFEGYLRAAGIHPRPDVLQRLQLLRDTAIVTAGSPAEALHWYEWARDLPRSPTRGRFRSVTGFLLNGPSAVDANILLAYDAGGGAAMFKAMPSVGCDEVVAARAVFGGPGLVPCELRSAEREDGSIFCGLLMPKYERSLAAVPELVLSEEVLYERAQTLLAAVRHMHHIGFVHMDIKEANVFVGDDGSWWLGDFGSAVREGASIVSTTRGLHPELEAWHLQPPQPARCRYDMYMLTGLLVRQLDAPRDRAGAAPGSAGPSSSAVRERVLRVRFEALRTLLSGLFEEAGLS